MPDLREYLGSETLEQLTGLFSEAVGSPVRIISADEAPLAGAASATRLAGQMRIVVAGRHVGSIALDGSAGPPTPEGLRLLGLMRDMLTRLCEQAHQLRERVEELAAMYRLTEVFTGRRSLEEVHRLAAETMVKVTGADACSIRVFNDDRTELLCVAACGLSRQYMDKGSILLADSQIDQQVVATGQCVYIADERTDERVLYQAEARREGIVSALCAPMAYKGRVEGVVRVYTRRRHEFDWFETSLIRGVASQAAAAIVNARLYAEALSAERIRRHLRLAGEVQRRMIPARPPHIEGVDVAAVYVPCFELGGDFYDFIELPADNWGLCVADVVGKGVRASLLMASARSSLRAHAFHMFALSDVLSAVNVDMWCQSDESDFLTMFYGVLDVRDRRLTYCNAGHEPPLLVRGGQVRALGSSGGVIGMDPHMQYGHEVLELRSGDALLMYTDGLPEAINFDDEAFGRERVRSAALSAVRRGETAEGIGKHVLWEMRRFAGLQRRFDDLTLVVVRFQ
ncbi:MAG: hypothetical protein B1H04_00070 [Planctomycetales bacterium 4484_123]|nr:MAG: hypothetical protein B1H04_00070 [Planctomycetales bacterium 4484_123]